MYYDKNNNSKDDRDIRFCNYKTVFQPVSPLVKTAAYAVPLCVLPSALWRVYAVFVKGFLPECERLMKDWEPFYIVALSVVTLGAAFLTIGLVRPWGEVVPGWIPILAGRAVPLRVVVISAGAGAASIFGVYAYALLNPSYHFREITVVPGCPAPTEEPGAWLAIASYAPLLAWGPLLVAVIIAYYRRRIRALTNNNIHRLTNFSTGAKTSMNKISFSEKSAEPSEKSSQIKETMHIRRVGALEAEQLTRLALASKNYWKNPDSWINERRENLTITPGFVFWNDVFAATIDEKIIGFYALVAEKGRLRLEHFWIEPEFIGNGIGRRLLRHAIKRAFDLNAESIEILSDPNAEEFYKKAGATRIGEEITEIEGARRILPRLKIKTKSVKV